MKSTKATRVVIRNILHGLRSKGANIPVQKARNVRDYVREQLKNPTLSLSELGNLHKLLLNVIKRKDDK